MTANPAHRPADPEPVSDQIHKDHEALHAGMETLGSLFDPTRAKEVDFTAWKLDILSHLRDFQADLARHFDLEEETMYRGELVRLAPQYAYRIDHLEEEHLKIAADLDHVIAMTKRVRHMDNPILKRIDQRLHAVLDCLSRHEADERELIQDAYYQDLGVGD